MKKIKRKIDIRLMIVLLIAILSGVMLLHVSQRVQSAEEGLAQLERSARVHEDSLRVLGAEWSYLNSPQNLESLAKDALELVPVNPDVVMDNGEMPVPHKLPSLDDEADMRPQSVSSPLNMEGAQE